MNRKRVILIAAAAALAVAVVSAIYAQNGNVPHGLQEFHLQRNDLKCNDGLFRSANLQY
jgi:hypothetical protein